MKEQRQDQENLQKDLVHARKYLKRSFNETQYEFCAHHELSSLFYQIIKLKGVRIFPVFFLYSCL